MTELIEGKGIEIERRKFPRLNTNVFIEYYIVGKESRDVTYTKNIGAGGICIIVYEKIEPDTILSLKIFLPDKRSPMQIKGKVKWHSQFSLSSDQQERYDLGIEFVDTPEEDRQRISQYIFSLKPAGL